MLAVNGNEAQVSVTTDGITRQGTGIVYKNVIMFGQSQIATDDGQNGKIIYQVGMKSFMVPVTKYPPADSSSSVDRRLASPLVIERSRAIQQSYRSRAAWHCFSCVAR